MRIVTGSGKSRQQIEIPTGQKVGVTPEHVSALVSIMENQGVVFSAPVTTAKEESSLAVAA